MYLEDLSKYDLVVMWGAGNDALWYNKQFKLDYFVDSCSEKTGKQIAGIEIKSIDELVGDSLKLGKILIIVSSSKYARDIKGKIEELDIVADVTELSVMKAIYGFENRSFALWGFDILIRDILVRGGYDIENMSYMEVGACHPILGNNTYNFYLSGARGILIEPNPNLKEILSRYRTDECVMEGVASKSGILKYYSFNNEFRNTFDKVKADDAVNKGFILNETLELPVETLDSIIIRHNIVPENTLLSIQVMGFEFDILKSFDYKRYRFPLIALSVYSDEIFEHDIFKDYHVIASVPRHVILVNDSIYKRILG